MPLSLSCLSNNEKMDEYLRTLPVTNDKNPDSKQLKQQSLVTEYFRRLSSVTA